MRKNNLEDKREYERSKKLIDNTLNSVLDDKKISEALSNISIFSNKDELKAYHKDKIKNLKRKAEIIEKLANNSNINMTTTLEKRQPRNKPHT